MQIDQLIKELIATGTINQDTLVELNRMLADFESGKLDPDDEVYLRALHARLTNAPLLAPEETVAEVDRIDGHSIAEWRERALKAEAEAAALRDQLASESTSS